MNPEIDALARDILGRAERSPRYVVAIAGAPGAGKSTLAEALVDAMRGTGGRAALLPMDGFHYDNAVLDARGLRARKGAPDTFDVDGLAATLARVRSADRPVAVPVFDRSADLARAGARIVEADVRVVVVEGNYLLLADAPWSGLAPMFDRRIYVDVPEAELARRLTARWLRHGFDPPAARARAEGNDLPNARVVAARSTSADVIWRD